MHAASQHTPSTQNPVEHCDEPPHIAPIGFFATQLGVTQYPLGAHAASSEHDIMQMLPAHPALHCMVPPARHFPAPLQTERSVAKSPVHEPGAQGKLSGFFAPHAPAPSQRPVPSQGICCVAHSLSGSVAAAMLPHTPSLPLPFFAAVHATHEPPQAVSQQTPSMQLDDMQSVSSVHGEPLTRLITGVPPVDELAAEDDALELDEEDEDDALELDEEAEEAEEAEDDTLELDEEDEDDALELDDDPLAPVDDPLAPVDDPLAPVDELVATLAPPMPPPLELPAPPMPPPEPMPRRRTPGSSSRESWSSPTLQAAASSAAATKYPTLGIHALCIVAPPLVRGRPRC